MARRGWTGGWSSGKWPSDWASRRERIRNWELGHTEPALRCWPRVIEFLGFVPFQVGDSLGERIRAWRKMNGVPRSDELADRLGVDESTVWRWEAGQSRPAKHLLRPVECLVAAPHPSH